MGKNWVWLTRDSSGETYDVHLKKRPLPKRGVYSGTYNGDIALCASLFEKGTDFKLEPGEKAKVEITIKRKE